jgi:hypothetical protein
MVFNGQPGRKCGREHERVGADCGLHPLIHTFPSWNSAQNLVAWSQEGKCGLKYVMHSPRKVVGGFTY